jgi:hypothetical protein
MHAGLTPHGGAAVVHWSCLFTNTLPTCPHPASIFPSILSAVPRCGPLAGVLPDDLGFSSRGRTVDVCDGIVERLGYTHDRIGGRIDRYPVCAANTAPSDVGTLSSASLDGRGVCVRECRTSAVGREREGCEESRVGRGKWTRIVTLFCQICISHTCGSASAASEDRDPL